MTISNLKIAQTVQRMGCWSLGVFFYYYFYFFKNSIRLISFCFFFLKVTLDIVFELFFLSYYANVAICR